MNYSLKLILQDCSGNMQLQLSRSTERIENFPWILSDWLTNDKIMQKLLAQPFLMMAQIENAQAKTNDVTPVYGSVFDRPEVLIFIAATANLSPRQLNAVVAYLKRMKRSEAADYDSKKEECVKKHLQGAYRKLSVDSREEMQVEIIRRLKASHGLAYLFEYF